MRGHRQFIDEVDYIDAQWDVHLASMEAEIQQEEQDKAIEESKRRNG